MAIAAFFVPMAAGNVPPCSKLNFEFSSPCLLEYLEFSFLIKPISPVRDILVASLSETGFESFVETETGLLAYIPKKEFNTSDFEMMNIFKNSDFKISWEIKTIPHENWNAVWESNFEPITVRKKCCIRAPFHNARPDFEYDIVIEPKMSFGTGHHSTTYLMIKKLLELDIKNRPVLDMGCGTGVLAILASKMGADPVMAIDIDELAYNNTFENIIINKCAINVYKGGADLLQGKTFHAILANINRNVLLKDMQTYSSSLQNSGNLVMSGFFESDIAEISREAFKNGLKLEDKQTHNTWSLLHFIK